MDQKIINGIGIAGIVAGLMIGLATLSYADSYSQSIQPSSFRSFQASGSGKVVAIPDIATFSFGVTTEDGTDIAALQADNAAKIKKAIEYLKSQGVADKDIQTQDYNLTPRYQYYECGPIIYSSPMGATSGSAAGSSGSTNASSGTTSYPSTGVTAPAIPTKVCPPSQIVGYTINESVLVKVRDFTKIGAIIGGVVQNGANTTSGLSFAIDDPTKLQDQARAEAIGKAKTSAEATAEAGGFRLGRLISIQENGNGYRPVYFDLSAGGAKEVSSAPAPTIEPGSKDVTSTVTLTYEIK